MEFGRFEPLTPRTENPWESLGSSGDANNSPEEEPKKRRKQQKELNASKETDEKHRDTKNQSEKPNKKTEPEQNPHKQEVTPDAERETKKRELAKEYVAQRLEEVRLEAEESKPGTPEHLAAVADAELLETLEEKLAHPELAFDEAVEEAYEQVMLAMEEVLAEAEDVENLQDEPHEELQPETVTAASKPASSSVARIRRALGLSSHRPAKQPKTIEPQLASTPAPASLSAESRPQAAAPGPEAAAPSATSNKEIEQAQKPRKTPHRRALSTLSALAAKPNTTVNAPRSETSGNSATPATTVEKSVRRSFETPERQIQRKEERIRQLVTRQVIEAPPQAKSPKPEVNPPVHREQLQPLRTPEYFATEPLREAAPEKKRGAASEWRQQPSIRPESPTKQAEQLSTPDLLIAANNVRLEGTTARRLYETNQIDRSGLLSIVKAALRGGDVKKAFAKARLGEEAQRGRKIEMRHDDPAFIPHYKPEPPRDRLQTVLNALAATTAVAGGTAGTPVTPVASTDKVTADPIALSQQKAEAAFKKKRAATLTITISTAVGIGIGIALALLLL